MTGEDFMRRAIFLSMDSVRRNAGGPFGAVIVKDGKIIAEGTNQVTPNFDPTAHAEIVAIRAATAALGDFSLKGCEIYSSCEPCPMCLAAIYWARIDRIWFANNRDDAARIGFDDEFLYGEIGKPLEARAIPTTGLLRDEAAQAFRDWEASPDKRPY